VELQRGSAVPRARPRVLYLARTPARPPARLPHASVTRGPRAGPSAVPFAFTLGMPELTLQQKKEREADNAKERSTRRAVQTYTSAESHADGEALHLNRALLACCSATFAQRPRCLRPS
jgi:hypothetical protein